jgi:hypothetical protein
MNGFYLGPYFMYFVAIFLTYSSYNESCQKACQNGYQSSLFLYQPVSQTLFLFSLEPSGGFYYVMGAVGQVMF